MSDLHNEASSETTAVVMSLAEAYAYAQNRLEAQDTHSALQACEALLAAYPRDVRGNLLMGEVQYELGSSERAGEHFDRVLSADPENTSGLIGAALAEESSGDRATALAAYRLAVQLDPTLSMLRERVEALSQGPQPRFTHEARASVQLAAGDPLAALAQLQMLGEESRAQPWARLALLQALWTAGRESEATDLAAEVQQDLPDSLKPVLISSWKLWSDGDLDRSAELMSGLRDRDSLGEYLAANAHLAPFGWQAPRWEAGLSLAVSEEYASSATETVQAPEGTDDAPSAGHGVLEEPAGAAPVAGAEALAGPVEGLTEPAVPADEPFAREDFELAESEPGTYDYDVEGTEAAPASLPDLAELYADLESEAPSWWNTVSDLRSEEEPLQVPVVMPGESDPSTPDVPEAPAMPEAQPDVPEPRPEVTDVPTGPDIEPPTAEPEVEPDYTPQPEVPEVPPTTMPDVIEPGTPPGVPAVDPGGTPTSPLAGLGPGLAPEPMAVSRAVELEAAGYYADALELYAQAFRRGELEVTQLLNRVTAMEPHLTGYAPWHRLLGDLYRMSGYSRRAMREYQLALQTRRRKS